MDCLPLHVVDAAELQSVIVDLVFCFFAIGFGGFMVYDLARGLVWMAWRRIRIRRASVPFSQRVERMRAMRESQFLLLDRICERQARESTRRAAL